MCGYEAWSATDLSGHLKAAHGEPHPDERAAEIMAAQGLTPPTPPKPPAPAVVSPTPAPVATATSSTAPPTPPPTPPAPPEKATVVVVKEKAAAPESKPDIKAGAKAEEKYGFPEGIFIPAPQPDFWVAERVVQELYIVGKLTGRGQVINMKFLGPAGVGKTSLGFEYAAANKRPCYSINWGRFQEQSQVFGKDELDMEKGTKYSISKYVEAVETPMCVIVCDEPNRCPPEVLNTNFDLWDWRRSGWFDDLKRTVRVAPGVTFIACMNEGAEYYGTNPMDKAIRERFGRTIRLTWPPMKVEAQILQNRTGVDKDVADKLARFARDVRRNPKIGCTPSTRQLLVAAEDVAEGLPLPEAVMYAIINDLDEGADRKALLQHLQVIGKVDESWVEGTETVDDDDK
jgi:nitric oxide reductase NorQ protein